MSMSHCYKVLKAVNYWADEDLLRLHHGFPHQYSSHVSNLLLMMKTLHRLSSTLDFPVIIIVTSSAEQKHSIGIMHDTPPMVITRKSNHTGAPLTNHHIRYVYGVVMRG